MILNDSQYAELTGMTKQAYRGFLWIKGSPINGMTERLIKIQEKNKRMGDVDYRLISQLHHPY